MRALEFIRDHVTFKLPYDFSYQMKTPQYNYELGLQYQQIFNGKNPFEDCKLSVDQGIYLLQKLEIGKMRYRDLKKFLSEFCHLPGYEKLSERIHDLMPKLISSENGGVWTDIKDILTRHLSATIEFLSDYDEDSFDFTNLQTKWTLGYGWFFSKNFYLTQLTQNE